MAGILSGLKSLGLEKLDGLKIFEEEQQEEKAVKQDKVNTVVAEKDFIYDRTFTCPICDEQFRAKVMKTGKAKLLSMDLDLRPRYEGIDFIKYDVKVCPKCGYATLGRYFLPLSDAQVKMVRESISNKVQVNIPDGEIYAYEDVMEHYKLALVCAIVRHAKDSEKAYICLRSAWLYRGYAESLEERGQLTKETREELKKQEEEYIQNALEGFITARKKENMPICGMDQTTVDYLIAALAYLVNRDEIAAKMVSNILVSNTANDRTKDKARELKSLILNRHKKDK